MSKITNYFKKIIKFCLRPIARPTIYIAKRLKANHYLKKKIKLSSSKINIVFICQCVHIWDKQRSVVERLSHNNMFKVILLIVEDNGIIEDTVFEKYAIENKIDFYKYEKGILKKIQPNIICYSRPYDLYLPKDIRSSKTVKHSKLIYIPYGYSMMELGETNLNFEFIRNLSLLFADCKYSNEYFKENNLKNIKRGIQESVNIGFPYLEDLIINKNSYINNITERNAFENLNNNRINAIWTPRWTTNDKLGGSNFFRYIDKIFDLLIDNPNYNFVFRPHPYAIDNYVKEGLLSNKKRDEYLAKIRNSDNSIYDKDDFYLKTFDKCDIMITDISSIVPEALLLYKPIIFCHNLNVEILNDFAKKCCEEAFYNAYNFDDILKYVNMIKDGNDPIKEKRESFIDSFVSSQKGTIDRLEKVLIAKKDEWFK